MAYLLDTIFRQGLGCDIDRVLLHLIAHIRIFDHSLSLFAHYASVLCIYSHSCIFAAISVPIDSTYRWMFVLSCEMAMSVVSLLQCNDGGILDS